MSNYNWTIPLRISISIGQPSGPSSQGPQAQAVVRPLASLPEIPEEGVVVDQDYSDRPGYDPKFLDGVVAPLPVLDADMKADTAQVRPDAMRNGNPYELAYHYSVDMNRRRRIAWFSAANVDGDRRPDIGQRQGDRWYVDTRILRSEQLGQEAFESGIDRGHLTRREDTAWGDDVKTATRANNDTFHFTNCSLQAAPFNRGKDRWRGLERYLLEQHANKEKRRMIVMTGPLFAPNDPVYKNERMSYSVRCSLQFWKVCVLVRQDGSASATSFVLGQEDIQNLAGFQEAFDVVATQVTIADLEKRTRLNFGVLGSFDRFAAGGKAGTLEMPFGADGATSTIKAIKARATLWSRAEAARWSCARRTPRKG